MMIRNCYYCCRCRCFCFSLQLVACFVCFASEPLYPCLCLLAPNQPGTEKRSLRNTNWEVRSASIAPTLSSNNAVFYEELLFYVAPFPRPQSHAGPNQDLLTTRSPLCAVVAAECLSHAAFVEYWILFARLICFVHADCRVGPTKRQECRQKSGYRRMQRPGRSYGNADVNM